MKQIKWILAGIAVILFGVCAILLAGLSGTPTFHNDMYELLGVSCPFTGLAVVLYGLFCKSEKNGEEKS